MPEPRTRVLFLGSHLRSFHCLRYLLTQVPQAQVVGIVPHFSNTGVREDQRVEALAVAHGVPYLTYEDIAGLDYDLGISLLFDRKLPPAIVDAPPRGFVNIHMAPLPRFRGANGVMHALMKAREDGVWSFGVTLHYIDHELDTGPIIDLIEFPIFEDDTASTLHARASDRVFELFVRNIHPLVETPGRVSARPQEGHAYFFRRADVDHRIDLNSTPDAIYDKVRALTFTGRPKPFVEIGKYRFYLSLEP